jgi:ATP-binding cassette, subfamily B, bacterial
MGRPESIGLVLPQVRRILRHFGPHIRRQRGLIAGSMCALVAEVALRLLEPWPLKVVFDNLLGARHGRHHALAGLGRLDPATLVVACVLAVVVLAALRALAAYYSSVGFALIGNRVLTDLRQELYLHVQRLSLSFHARSGSGELVVRIIGDVGLLKDVAVTALLPMVGSLMVLAGMAGVMLWLDWRLGLMALAVLPLFWLSTLRLGRQIHDVARLQRKREGAMAARAAESMGGVNTVKSLGLEGTFGAMFARESARSLTEGVRGKRLEASLERSADVLTGLATALVLGYGTFLALRREISPGDLIVFLSYMKNAFRPIRDFAKYAGRMAKAAAAGERVVDLLEHTPDVVDRPDAVAAPALRGAVRFDHVSFEYERGQAVLRDVDVEVAPGSRVAVVGPSGSGKSTLAGLILRLHDPSGGRVLVDGRDVREYTLASLRAQVAVLLQDALLFAASVRDNIAYGAAQAGEEEIVAAARLANAQAFIEALPEGYDSVLGERGVTLSAGQRQRIAIARAALSRAPIVILDEPTTGLDVENERAVVQALERLTAGRTTFTITHDLDLAAGVDVVLRLEGGYVTRMTPPPRRRGQEERYPALVANDALSR